MGEDSRHQSLTFAPGMHTCTCETVLLNWVLGMPSQEESEDIKQTKTKPKKQTVPKNTSKRLICYMEEIFKGVWKLEWGSRNEMPTEIVWWCYNGKFSVGFGEPC